MVIFFYFFSFYTFFVPDCWSGVTRILGTRLPPSWDTEMRVPISYCLRLCLTCEAAFRTLHEYLLNCIPCHKIYNWLTPSHLHFNHDNITNNKQQLFLPLNKKSHPGIRLRFRSVPNPSQAPRIPKLDLSVPLKCWEIVMGSNLTQESSGKHSKVLCCDVVMGSSGYLLLLKSNDMHIASIKVVSVRYSSVF